MEHRIRQDQLTRIDAQDIGEQPRGFRLRQSENAGRNIDPGERQLRLRAAANAGERHQIVGFRGRQQLFLGDRARRHQAHDIAPDHRLAAALLRLGRVLHLFADGNTETQRDQLLQIVVGGVHRHAAHRNILAHVLAALGERDAERARRVDGILEEQLVEIAHAIEQQRTGIVRLDLDILLHHRRGRSAALLRGKLGGRESIDAGNYSFVHGGAVFPKK